MLGGGVTNEGEDTGGTLSVQADHPIAEHREEQRGNHSHRHNVKQQDCCVVGGSAIGPCIPLSARQHTKGVGNMKGSTKGSLKSYTKGSIKGSMQGC